MLNRDNGKENGKYYSINVCILGFNQCQGEQDCQSDGYGMVTEASAGA